MYEVGSVKRQIFLMSRFLKICTNVQIFEQLLHATIANLIGPHRFANCQLITASASISRKEEKIAVIIFGNF